MVETRAIVKRVMLVRVRLRRLAVVLSLSLLSAALSHGGVNAQQSPAGDVGHHLVLGYYVPYDGTSWASLQAHADQLDIVAMQWVDLDACGNLTSRDDQTLNTFARSHGLTIVPSLFTVSGWLNHQVLNDEQTASTAVQNIVAYTLAEGYQGFDLDLEGVDAGDRDALSAFVGTAADALHAEGKLLTLAIPAKDRDVRSGWSGAYDYAALGAAADLITVMAYEYRGPFSGPGSVAPYAWVQRVARFATSQMSPEKVLLGLAFYGYDWNTSSGAARSVGYAQFAALAEQHGAEVGFDQEQQSLSFVYQGLSGEPLPSVPAPPRPAHAFTSRQAPRCDLQPPLAPPAPRAPAIPAGVPQDHAVWLEDATSAAARLGLADEYHMRGVSTWRLGLEDPAVWPLFDEWRAAGR